VLRERFPQHRHENGKTVFDKVNYVRYADDFIITGKSEEFLREEVLPVVQSFMQERGLQLSKEKTVITHIDDGFDFLGQNIRKYGGKLLIKPSKSSKKAFLAKIRSIIKGNKSASQEYLIRALNPVIRGWVNYHRYVVSSETFAWIDFQIFNCLWQWAKRRHKKKSHKWIARRYWHSIGTRKWTFAAKLDKAQQEPRYLALEYATNTKIIRFKKIVAEANPFDERWNGYYEERDGERMLNSTKGRVRLLALWRSQKRCCPVCKDRINSETGFRTHTILQNGGKKLIVMVHPLCHRLIHDPSYLF
jgi:RNA-directed DNA polymerase